MQITVELDSRNKRSQVACVDIFYNLHVNRSGGKICKRGRKQAHLRFKVRNMDNNPNHGYTNHRAATPKVAAPLHINPDNQTPKNMSLQPAPSQHEDQAVSGFGQPSGDLWFFFCCHVDLNKSSVNFSLLSFFLVVLVISPPDSPQYVPIHA